MIMKCGEIGQRLGLGVRSSLNYVVTSMTQCLFIYNSILQEPEEFRIRFCGGKQ